MQQRKILNDCESINEEVIHSVQEYERRTTDMLGEVEECRGALETFLQELEDHYYSSAYL